MIVHVIGVRGKFCEALSFILIPRMLDLVEFLAKMQFIGHGSSVRRKSIDFGLFDHFWGCLLHVVV